RFGIRRGELLEIAGNELQLAPMIVDRKRPGIPNGEVFCSRLGFLEVNRRERWTVRAVRQLALLRRDYRVDPLRPAQIAEWRQTAGAVKDEIVLQRHVPDGSALLGDERQVAIGSPNRKQTHQTRIDLRRLRGSLHLLWSRRRRNMPGVVARALR